MAPGMMIAENQIQNVSHWSVENGYESEQINEEYPIRVAHAGRGGALEINFVFDTWNFDEFCQNIHSGFTAMLILPGEWCTYKHETFVISLVQETNIQIVSKMITTADGLRNYSPSQRKCFYQSERPLRFFKIYTVHNCKLECLANALKRTCGCVHYSMPSMNTS